MEIVKINLPIVLKILSPTSRKPSGSGWPRWFVRMDFRIGQDGFSIRKLFVVAPAFLLPCPTANPHQLSPV